MNNLFQIVQFVTNNSSSPKIALARMSLMVGEDVTKVNSATPSNQEKLERFKKVAENITGQKIS
jgi:hypothetical protein